ncbi:TetR/AcrR family transcriptional regulator C-terminal ligand-binding domain-containing protein [Actinoplanes sp. Pm04-4]|uniref:TetR/AcrR family transcriptional regulator C-terminal ligand-binding domain-containing protein n=1 Tax=Paractinoplanes pyxinae TaxID=2997416 RepID=A0ABT4BAY7_9ACTN|nr:TetR/AcrR family transcriptional regulator [Actinoplanes pyxinae]MCY1143694.1 TetR/AcrR family transcriptional regulator C-terminal ligand-binding domain-containing protein [Actinoplanes pyxinae]
MILEAALDVLAETGYDGMTVDMVAVRAGAARATVYRRWPTKIDLVLHAVRRLAPGRVDVDQLPDTGSLRGDCIALMQPDTSEEAERRVRAISGLQSIAGRDERIAAVLADGGMQPWIDANRVLIQRAVDRKEYGPVDVDTLAQMLPLMCTCRVAVQQLPITPEYAIGLIDAILLPAMRGAQP